MSHDLVLVGGGLQNGLVALAVLAGRPGARLAVVEQGATLGGDHTWSFHAGDVPAALEAVVAPLVVHRWPGYDVRFPGFDRTLDEPYASITSARFAQVVGARLAAAGALVSLGTRVVDVSPGAVHLDDGRTLNAPVIVDARGPDPRARARGWQKFVGLELRLGAPVAPARPIVMDATVDQLDGYRFVYVLPLAPDRVLVEDTYYSDDPHLDDAVVAARARAWVDAAGWPVAEVLRQERGVLPIPAEGGGAAPVTQGPGGVHLGAGYGSGWFHPTTGYSLPVALRLAALVAGTAPAELPAAVTRAWAEHGKQARFARLLNRLLFDHFAPDERRHVLERFYRLPAATVRRFYALDTTLGDRARVLCGRPPRGLRWRARRPVVQEVVS